MRVVAWFLVALVILVGTALVYTLYATELQASAMGVTVTSALEREAEFLRIRQAVEERSLIGTQFLPEPLGEAADYEFHTYTVRGKNNGFLPADWIRLDVQPQEGDVLQIDRDSANHLPSFSEGIMEVTVLAKRGTATGRNISMSYFIWSRLYSVTAALQ